ncbi:MAG TPA: VOC family protein [Chitinophagaceae bacterium]|nr:VOC family protein [Chitinophagaceae bacterium]
MKKLILFIAVITLVKVSDAQVNKPVLNHIAFYVKDLQRSTNFYRDFIGLDTIPEPFHDGKHTWFSIGPKSHLHIISGETKTVVREKTSHLCFSITDMKSFLDKLNKAGIPYEDWAGKKQSVTNRVDGVKQIYLQDPDGFWLEINDAKD